jgi:predicted short-subunit dehydrogenase-like oxidoreductase (DUF2520 family)
MSERLAIIGCGRVGSNLALALQRIGHNVVAVVDENDEAAQACAHACGADTRVTACTALPSDLSMIFIAVADDQITTVARTLTVSSRTVVCHLSGAMTSDALAVLKPATALLASWHPVQTFSQPLLNSQLFFNIWFALEGEDAALRRLQPIIQELTGRSFVVSKDKKALYHLACTLAANYMVANIFLVQQVLSKAELPSLEVLSGLMRTTLENTIELGPAAALTGPIVRGDVVTVSSHLHVLKQELPHLAPIYQTLGRQLLALARQTRNIPAYDQLEEILNRGI